MCSCVQSVVSLDRMWDGWNLKMLKMPIMMCSLPVHHMTAMYCVAIPGMEQRFSGVHSDTTGAHRISAVLAV